MTVASSPHDRHDVFISYASEDRETVARPLALALADLGLSVWYDEFQLELGDSLRASIDSGLAQSRFGVVVLSDSFFQKHYPQRELNGLAQREVEGDKVILPIWKDVQASDVRRFSPPLADRLAANWSDGLDRVAFAILKIVRPDLIEIAAKRMQELVDSLLPRITLGGQLGSIIGGVQAYQHYHDEIENEREAALIGGCLQDFSDWGDIWQDIGPGGQADATLSLKNSIDELTGAGWTLFGRRARRSIQFGETKDIWSVATLVVVRGEPTSVSERGGRVQIIRADAKIPLNDC